MTKNTHPDKARRRADAVARQAKRDARTTDEQLRILDTRPGESTREAIRLLKRKLAA